MRLKWRGQVTDAANAHARAGKSTKGRLGTRSGRLGSVATGGADLHVQSRDAELLALGSNVLGGQHGSIRGRLVTIGLHLHAAGHTDDRLTTSQVSDVHKSVVKGGEDVGNAEDELAGTDLRPKGNVLLDLDFACLLPEEK